MLFFVENATGNLAAAYQEYVELVKPEKLASHEQLGYYVREPEPSLEVLLTGIPKEAIEKLFANDPESEKKAKRLKKLSEMSSEFPFGGAIVYYARKHTKPVCLVSSIRRHASNYLDSASSSAAVVLLAPLLGGILTAEQLLYDGKNSLTYMGGDQIIEYGGGWEGKGKADPKVWVEAIRRVLAQ